MAEEVKELEQSEAPADQTRTAKDYAEAVEAIADLAAVAVEFVPGLSKVKAVGKAAKILPKAAKALKVAAPALDNAMVAGALDKAKDAALKPMMDKKVEAEAAKARKEARRSVVESAEAMTIADFEKRFATYRSLSEGDGLGYLAQPGCYVFLLLGKGLKRDLADYREVYVGSSRGDMGRAISDELKGLGNVDVYADAKYGQILYVLPYPCSEDKVEALEESLIIALDANVSYNAVRM